MHSAHADSQVRLFTKKLVMMVKDALLSKRKPGRVSFLQTSARLMTHSKEVPVSQIGQRQHEQTYQHFNILSAKVVMS